MKNCFISLQVLKEVALFILKMDSYDCLWCFLIIRKVCLTATKPKTSRNLCPEICCIVINRST